MRNDLFANTFPNITRWVTERCWIEIGQDENSKSLVRAVDSGGLAWESNEKQTSIDDALHALENHLKK
jgi:hypothetical protein